MKEFPSKGKVYRGECLDADSANLVRRHIRVVCSLYTHFQHRNTLLQSVPCSRDIWICRHMHLVKPKSPHGLGLKNMYNFMQNENINLNQNSAKITVIIQT